MNTIDRNLLFLASENSRWKIKEMGVLLKKSSQLTKYSLEALKKEEILYKPYCVLDYSYLGLTLFRVYFRGAYITENDKNEVLQVLQDNPYVVAIYELSGEFDLVIEMQAPNPSRFNKELKKLGTQRQSLNNYKVVLNVVTHLYVRAYLPSDNQLVTLFPEEIVVGGDRQLQDFDGQERAVISAITNNPLARLTTLAKLANLNVKTAAKVFSRLQHRRLIRGFQYLVRIDRLGIAKFRLFLKLHNQTQNRDTDLLNFMLHTMEIVQLNRTVGDWDMEIDIESYDRVRVRELIREIREQFKDLIETFNILELFDRYKRVYLAEYCLQQLMDKKSLEEGHIEVGKEMKPTSITDVHHL